MLLSDLLELTYAGNKLSQNAFALYWAESDEAKKVLKEEVEKWRNRILSVEPTGPEKVQNHHKIRFGTEGEKDE